MGGDFYITPSTTLVFLAGETEKTCTVTVGGDYIDESDETAVIEAVSRGGNVVASTSFRIIDNDTQSYIGVADLTVDEGAGEATFLVTFSAAPGVIGSFQYETQDLYATAGTDYVAKSGTIDFGPEDTSIEVHVPLIDDREVEFDENFQLKLSNLVAKQGIYLHRNVSIATIRDNDKPGTPIVTLAATSPLEGDAGQRSVPVFVRLAAVSVDPIEVAILTKAGTAGAGTDFVPLSTSITFLPGETEKQVMVDVIGDTQGEGDESLTITATYEGSVVASMTLTITDDDTIYYVALSDASVVEGTGASSTATFRVMFLPPPLSGGTVQYKTEHDTANASDYAPVSGTLAFSAGETSLTIPVEIFGDATGEKDERFRMRILNPTGGVLLFDDLGIATIYDDDGPIVRPTLSINDVAVTETNGAAEAQFTLKLSKVSDTNVTVHYETEDGTARAGEDYGSRSGTVTFAPGEKSKTIVIPIAGDTEHEETETFNVLLSNGNGAVIPDLTGTCTITDDDPAKEERSKRRAARH